MVGIGKSGEAAVGDGARVKWTEAGQVTSQLGWAAETDARLWALYGAACVKANRLDAAKRAFSQALYLRQRAQDAGRAHALRVVMERLGLGHAA